MSDLKICAKCKWRYRKWVEGAGAGYYEDVCFYEKNERTNLVTGDTELIVSKCEDHRAKSFRCNGQWKPDLCGIEGRWFEPR